MLRTPKALIAISLAVFASALRAEPDVRAYELSERCGKLVADLFKKEWGNGVSNDGNTHAVYQSHYNSKLNKCFFEQLSSGVVVNKKTKKVTPNEDDALYDANENKEYGAYIEYGERVMLCYLNDKLCVSKEEWQSLVKPFMED